jgi:Zinc-finger associated domain (zf-AD)
MSINTDESCRCCMMSSCTFVSIFEEHEGHQLSQLITEISGVKIEIHDSLSKKICKECEARAIELLKFRQLCIDSDETVRYNLMLADDGDSEVNEIIADETLKVEGEGNIDQLEEYFIEDDGETENTEYQHGEQHLEYDELFVNDSGEEIERHEILSKFESIDEDESYDMKSDTEQKHSVVVIQRYETKNTNAANSSLLSIPTDELTIKMREAHFAKEQQKKHKCPHCDKFFMFPSKGL